MLRTLKQSARGRHPSPHSAPQNPKRSSTGKQLTMPKGFAAKVYGSEPNWIGNRSGSVRATRKRTTRPTMCMKTNDIISDISTYPTMLMKRNDLAAFSNYVVDKYGGCVFDPTILGKERRSVTFAFLDQDGSAGFPLAWCCGWELRLP